MKSNKLGDKTISIIIVILFVVVAFSPIYMNNIDTSSANGHSVTNNQQINPSLSVTPASNPGRVKYTLLLRNNSLLKGNVLTTTEDGMCPDAVAYDPANTYMYVINDGSNNVSVINSTTNKVVHTISVGKDPKDVAYDPTNTYMYVISYCSNSVSVINSRTNTLFTAISVGDEPSGVSYDPTNKYMYVTNYGSNNVSVINKSNKVIDTISVGCLPRSVAYDPANTYMYVTNYGSNNVSVINESNNVIHNIGVGFDPFGVSYDQANTNMYVTNYGSNNVSVINESNNVIDAISVGCFPRSVAYDPANTYMYVTNYGSNNVSIISNTTNEVVHTIRVGNGPKDVAYDPINTYMYVINYHSGTVSIIGDTYAVTFTESSLPTGTTWYVNVTNTTTNYVFHELSTTSTISLELTNGSYTYTVATSNKIYAPSSYSGKLTVNGQAITEPTVTFSPVKYSVTFTESGLQSGTWYVNVTNTTTNYVFHELSTTSTISLELTNGSYSYTIATSNKIYKPSSSSGSFQVKGANLAEKIKFSPFTYKVTFTESGLQSGTWYVNITGQSSSGPIAAGTSYLVDLVNGSYSYTIATSNKIYAPSLSSSSFQVKGANLPEAITFSQVTYKVTFTESGLQSGTWYVNVTNTTTNYVFHELSTTSTISFNLVNGSYTYSISSVSGFTIMKNATGSVTVNGYNQNINILFGKLYKVTFTENSLPPGTVWYVNVTVGPVVYSGPITGNTYTAYIPNGTHSYTIQSSNKAYSIPNSSGTLNVHGSTVNQPVITFTHVVYKVTFTEHNLPSGTTWYVNVSGQLHSSHNSTITVYMNNDTYHYTVTAVNGYTISRNATGNITVNGNNVSTSISFIKNANYTDYYIIGGIVAVIAAVLALLYITRGKRIVVKCPECKANVTGNPLKEWYFSKFKITRYECRNCHTKFNHYTDKKGDNFTTFRAKK